MSGFRPALGQTFAAIAVPNYRRYFVGQSISLIGSWMQIVSMSWLVLVLTGSSVDVGIAVAAQALPVLLLCPYGGVVADRVDKRRLMIVLQALMGLQALALGILTVAHLVRFWEVIVLALILGVNSAFENPARQSFMVEVVGPADLRNAVTLNSVMVNVAKMAGPSVAGVLIATAGIGVCFLVNAATFIAVIASLVRMDPAGLLPSKPVARASGQLREGFRYVRGTPELALPLLITFFVGTIAYEFQVSLPLMAREALHGGAESYGLMNGALGIGAVLGGLLIAARGRIGILPLSLASGFLGTFLVLGALAPSMPLELLALGCAGVASIGFLATSNSTLQLAAEPSMRGRVMSLWFVAVQGSTPIGGPLIGWIIAASSARVGLGVGGVAGLLGAAFGFSAVRRLARPAVAVQPLLADEETSITVA